MKGDVSTRAALEWLVSCLERHNAPKARRDAGPLIIATSLSERERWIPLISQVLEHEDGVLVDATGVGAEGVHCGAISEDAPQLVAAITALLEAYNRANSLAELRLVIADGRARVLGNDPFDAANAAQRAFREVATALCADDLRASSLVALVYAEDALDGENVALVWRTLMNVGEIFALGEQSTFLIIAGDGQLEPDLHCSGAQGLDFRVSSQGVETRKTWSVNCGPFDELGRHDSAQMPLLTLFLGAGASAGVGLKTGDRLRNEALADLSGRHVDGGNWRDVARAWFAELGPQGALSDAEMDAGPEVFVETLTLERVIEVEQDREGQVLSSTLRRFRQEHSKVFERLETQRDAGLLDADPLVNLVAAQKRLVLVTVNFDRIIEAKVGKGVAVFHAESELRGLGAYLDDYAANGGPVPLIKLHGDIEDAESLVVNLSETQAGLSLARNIALGEVVKRVQAQEQRPWWYVGYSMRDVDLANTWSNPSFAESVTERWIAPFLDRAVRDFVNRNRILRWQHSPARKRYDAQERLISLTADDAYRLLVDRVLNRW